MSSVKKMNNAEKAVWAAAYVAALHKANAAVHPHPVSLATHDAFKVVMELRQYVDDSETPDSFLQDRFAREMVNGR